MDWWALGALIFEMIDGFPPFYHENEMKVYRRIMSNDFKMGTNFSPELKDLISKFLLKDPAKRMGCNSSTAGVIDIQQHPWFETMNWKALYKGNLEPPYVPKFTSSLDTSHFDEYPEDVNSQYQVSKPQCTVYNVHFRL